LSTTEFLEITGGVFIAASAIFQLISLFGNAYVLSEGRGNLLWGSTGVVSAGLVLVGLAAGGGLVSLHSRDIMWFLIAFFAECFIFGLGVASLILYNRQLKREAKAKTAMKPSITPFVTQGSSGQWQGGLAIVGTL